MAIKRITPQSQVKEWVDSQAEMLRVASINALSYVGEECVIEARTNKTYKDQTGNLTSSIGYIIVEDGKIIKEGSFNKVASGGQGANEGLAFAVKVAKKYNVGLILIVVAGMEYSAYVTAMGYNVLDSSLLMARKKLPAMLKKLNKLK